MPEKKKQAKPKPKAVVKKAPVPSKPFQINKAQDDLNRFLFSELGRLKAEHAMMKKSLSSGRQPSQAVVSFVRQCHNVDSAIASNKYMSIPDDQAAPTCLKHQVTELILTMDASGNAGLKVANCHKYPMTSYVADFAGAATDVLGSQWTNSFQNLYDTCRVVSTCVKITPSAGTPQGNIAVYNIYNATEDAKVAANTYASFASKPNYKSFDGKSISCWTPIPQDLKTLATFEAVATRRTDPYLCGFKFAFSGCGNAFQYKIIVSQVVELREKANAVGPRLVAHSGDCELIPQLIARGGTLRTMKVLNVSTVTNVRNL